MQNFMFLSLAQAQVADFNWPKFTSKNPLGFPVCAPQYVIHPPSYRTGAITW